MLNLAVIGSGRGSNFQSILDAIKAGRIPARIGCVLSDDADAFILERARAEGLPAFAVDAAPYKTKLEGPGENRVLELLRAHGAELVVARRWWTSPRAPRARAACSPAMSRPRALPPR